MSASVHLRSDSDPPSTASKKRPRVTTNAKVPANANFLTPGHHTNSINSINAAVRSVPGSNTGPFSSERLFVIPVPMNGTPSTPGPRIGSFTAENNTDTVRPVLTNGSPSIPRPHVTPFDNTTITHTDKPSTRETQTISQALQTISHDNTTSDRPNISITHEKNTMQKENEGCDPRALKPSGTSSLANPTSSALSTVLLRWMPTPFQLIKLGHTDQHCPRVEVLPDNGLSKILDVGLHPVASAIAKIHLYGHHKSVPPEASQVLRLFDDIYRSDYYDPQITFLDPMLYSLVSHAPAQLEAFRRKEWAWLVRAGKPISLPDKLCGSWHLDTIQTNYQQLEIALVLSRDGDRMTFFPERTNSPLELGDMRVSHPL